jgi:hypothetical protein
LKRTEPLIFIIRFLVIDREPYRNKMRTVICLSLRSTNRTIPRHNWCGTDRGDATKFVRCIDKCCELGCFAFIFEAREPCRTKIQTDDGPPMFAVLNTKRLKVPVLLRYGSRSNTKKRTVKIKSSVRFTFLTVRQ